jgi:hypothetical protein
MSDVSNVSGRLESFLHAVSRGKMNILLHLVGLSFLFYGLAAKSVLFVLIGLFVFDEMRHAYNYFFVHNTDPKFGLRMLQKGDGFGYYDRWNLTS